MGYNGELISNLGVDKYLKGYEANKFSNIDILQTRAELERRWQECDFGCHGPAYRTMRRDARYNELLSGLAEESRIGAAIIDGVATSTYFAIEKDIEGTKRTAEGLGLAGSERQYEIGAANYALYTSVKVNIEKLLELDLKQFENHFSKMTFAAINEYISLIPERMLLEMIIAGAIILEPREDLDFYRAAVNAGMLDEYDEHAINESVGFLRSQGQRIVAKQIGRRIPKIVAGIIASRITRSMMIDISTDYAFKRQIARLRSTYRNFGGAPAKILITLLGLNGLLGIAERESRALNEKCPRLWSFLRHDLDGMDMLFFLVKDFMKEYIDRIALIETDPATFVALMGALARSGRTREIFFPN